MVNIDYYINDEGLYRDFNINKMEYFVNLCNVLKWGLLVIVVDVVIVEDDVVVVDDDVVDVIVVDVGGGGDVLILFIERLYIFI